MNTEPSASCPRVTVKPCTSPFSNQYIGLLLLLIITLFLSACDKPKSENPKYVVGILNPVPGLEGIVTSFKQNLTTHFEQDDRDIEFIHPTIIKLDEIDATLRSMQERQVDLVYTVATPPTIKAKKLFDGNGPDIIFAPIYDPIRSGVVSKLVNSGENITGIKVGGSNAKALEWLLTAAPNVKRILVPTSNSYKAELFSFSDLQLAADKLNIELVSVETKTIEKLESVLDTPPEKIDAIWLLHSAYLIPKVRLFVEAAIKHKIPLVSGTGQARRGVMISYGVYYHSVGKHAARLAYQLSHGISANDMPIETADFFLGINLKTASAAQVNIPQELLLQAEKIILNEAH